MPELGPRELRDFVSPYRVEPGRKVRLGRDFDPADTQDFGEEGAPRARTMLEDGVALLADYQYRLAAEGRRAVLVVIQAMDAAGKDGTIRHVMSGVNPQGVSVHGFKVPSAEELAHDYLWRYQQRLPERGQIGIFNRSHYEEVLVVRVHPELLAAQRLHGERLGNGVWRRRFREINDWERHLVDNGIHLVKIFLNLSREQQRIRFLARIDEATKNWKFSAADVRERAHWNGYQHAYSEVLSHTSTEWAPWYVIPADHKWFTRVVASAVIAHELVRLDPRFPEVTDEALALLEQARVELEGEAPPGAEPDPNRPGEPAPADAGAGGDGSDGKDKHRGRRGKGHR